MLSYSLKRVARGWPVFIALFLGVALSTTLFSGMLLGADAIGFETLNTALEQVPFDTVVSASTQNLTSINFLKVEGAVRSISYVTYTEKILRFSTPVYISYENATYTFTIVGVENTSLLYQGMKGIASVLGVNETIIDESSLRGTSLAPGDNVSVRVAVVDPGPPVHAKPNRVFNLTVSGVAELNDQVFAAAYGRYPAYLRSLALLTGRFAGRPAHNLLFVSMDTMRGFFDRIYNSSLLPVNKCTVEMLVRLDRNRLVDPWDVEKSMMDVGVASNRINNAVSSLGFSAANYLAVVLSAVQQTLLVMKVGFVIIALPVFFTAWYMSLTISDVSLGLRRREIGLLLTRGFTHRQVFLMFLVEALFIGLLSGGIGVLLSMLLVPLVSIGSDIYSSFSFLTLGTIVLSMFFSVALAFLSIFQPARRASKMSVVDALKEYQESEEVRLPSRRWPLVALALGSYKMALFLLGISLTFTPPLRAGIIVNLLFFIFRFIDNALNYIGPVLFFWGFTKLFVQGSFKLQSLIGRLTGRFEEGLSFVATQSARRNVRRTASTAFLVSLIVGYGFSVIAGLASSQDFIQRSIYTNVGADVSVWLFSDKNATLLKESTLNLSSVSSAAVEKWFYGRTSFVNIQIRAIEPEDWAKTAYYEEDWYSGSSFQDAVQRLEESNETIILDRGFAEQYVFKVGDYLTATLGGSSFNLSVVSLFGPKPQTTSQGESYPLLYSYIPAGLLNQTIGVVVLQTRILVRLVEGANATAVAEEVDAMSDNIDRIDSVAEQMRLAESNIFLMGSRRIRELGIPFTVMLSSIGVALVVWTTMEERRKEITLMSIRGLSFKQLVTMLVIENLGVILFSILLGLLVGYLSARGDIVSNVSSSLVTRRLIFPPYSLLTIGLMLAIIISSALIPIILAARRGSSHLEWRIRG